MTACLTSSQGDWPHIPSLGRGQRHHEAGEGSKQHLSDPQSLPKVKPYQYCSKEHSSCSTAWLLTHAGLLPSMIVQENKQDNSPPHRLQASRPVLQLLSSSHHEKWSHSAQAAEHDCSELPSPQLKQCRVLQPQCLLTLVPHTSSFRVTRALSGPQIEILQKRQHRREKEIHETENTQERQSCGPGSRLSSSLAENPQLTAARGVLLHKPGHELTAFPAPSTAQQLTTAWQHKDDTK